ncbi:hypothetical protein [uncultured Roseobacter sp.]|uniref:hypothetical protein n=1 Tax=uncultured Roseobacter sp. TaxID=114847 RepID=UPI002618C97A|nr:hypothetical protein [uncultured Roseobacter sp.]
MTLDFWPLARRVAANTKWVRIVMKVSKKRALAKNDIYSVCELRHLLHECVEAHIGNRMFGIGAVTAKEILAYLAD